MPDKDVKTIRDLIFYQYAKLITRSAFQIPDGQKVKKLHYGFIKKTFKDLKEGLKSWSEITREDWQFIESEKRCIYCGSINDLEREHIIPKSIHIKKECEKCEKIHGIHNQVWACGQCNSLKGTKGLYEFYRLKYPTEPKFYDYIPSLLEKKYLKTIYYCHECAQTLGAEDVDGNQLISIMDIDFILHRTPNVSLF